MGVSINTHIYVYNQLVHDIRELVSEEPDRMPEGRSLDEFLQKVLPKFGNRFDGYFVTIWNEYYEDYNPASELMQAVGLYFNLSDVWLGNYKTGVGGANAYEILTDVIGDEFDE